MVAELEGIEPADIKPVERELAKALKGAGDPEEILSRLLQKRGYSNA